MINIKGLDKAQLLLELYNHSHQQGMGMLQPSRNLTIEDARKLLEQTTSFDYLYGKVMKVDLSSDEEFEEWLYDRDNGQGMAKKIVDDMKKELEQVATESESKKIDSQPEIDPRTKFVVGSDEYNDYYFPKKEKPDYNIKIDKSDYIQPIDKSDYIQPIDKSDYIKPINKSDMIKPLPDKVTHFDKSDMTKPKPNLIQPIDKANMLNPELDKLNHFDRSDMLKKIAINNSILVDDAKTLDLVRKKISERGISKLFTEVPMSFDEIDESTFTQMQGIDQAHQYNLISDDVAINMIADLFERRGFCKKFEDYIDSVLMSRLKELFELLEIKYQDLLNALNTGKIDKAEFEARMKKLRELESNSLQEIISQNETLKGHSK